MEVVTVEIVTMLQGGQGRESREELEETETHRGARQKVSSIEVIYVCTRE